MLLSLIVAAAAGQAGVTAETVDKLLRERLAELRREIGKPDQPGLTITGASLTGRTLTLSYRIHTTLTVGLANDLDEQMLSLCEDSDEKELMSLGVAFRTVYRDDSGSDFTTELSERACIGPKIDSSKKWRTVRSNERIAVAIDSGGIVKDGSRREFEVVLLKAARADDEAMRKEIYTADCASNTYSRIDVVIYDDSSEIIARGDEIGPERVAAPGSPIEASLKAVCRGVWPDPTDRDLEGFVETSTARFAR